MAESEYIKRQTAIAEIREAQQYCIISETAITALKAIPTADVVEVVRCGQCKFAQHYECKVDPCYNHMRCTRREHYTEGVDEYDYCSYGERKEG